MTAADGRLTAMTGASSETSFEADVYLLTAEEGGRRSGIRGGYRCNCWIGHEVDGERMYNDASFHLGVVEELAPGATARARVDPHDPQSWAHVAAGSTFELCEGRRVVGRAVVVARSPSP